MSSTGLSVALEHSGEFDYVSNLHPATYPDGNDVEIMTMNALAAAWREAGRPLEREHATPYLWENPDRFRVGNVAWETGLDYSMSHRWTIDYEWDYQFIAAIYNALSRQPSVQPGGRAALHGRAPRGRGTESGIRWGELVSPPFRRIANGLGRPNARRD